MLGEKWGFEEWGGMSLELMRPAGMMGGMRRGMFVGAVAADHRKTAMIVMIGMRIV
jgi:hypothetical protein